MCIRDRVNAYRLVYQGNFSIQDALQKIEDQVPMSDEIHNIINFIPVSYTHLDVYKRQILYRIPDGRNQCYADYQ